VGGVYFFLSKNCQTAKKRREIKKHMNQWQNEFLGSKEVMFAEQFCMEQGR
jgi:uncharacterized protein YbcI